MPDPDCDLCDGTGVWPCSATGDPEEFCDRCRLPDGTCENLCGPCLVCVEFDKPVVIPGQLTMPSDVSDDAERES